MTIEATSRKAGPYAGNDVTTSFPFSFQVTDETYLRVIRTETDGSDVPLTLDTHYSVSLNADQDANPGGTVTYPVSGDPLADGEALTILGSEQPESQTTDLTNGGGFFPETLEARLDYITTLVQQHSAILARAVKGPATDAADLGELPVEALRAGKFLAFDVDGNPTVSAGSGGGDSSLREDLASTVSGTDGSRLIGFRRTNNGSAARSLYSILTQQPTVNVKDFGAVGDGVADDYQAFIDALEVGDVFVPYGTYKIVGRIPLKKFGIIGEGTSTNGATTRTLLVFYNQTNSALGSIYTDYPNWNKRAIPLSGFTARASSWDGVTGALGHGLDITARVRVFDVTVECFKEYGVFLHNTTVDGEAPYGSYFENLISTTNGKHGIVVGTGASTVTFVNPQGKWNGATSFGVNPAVAGNYDGFYINHLADGNPGSAFHSRLLESVHVDGGDCSYNSRYGWNITSLDSGPLFPGYAEGNLQATPGQVNIGNGVRNCFMSFSGVNGGTAGVNFGAQATIAGLGNTNTIYVGGQYCGAGNNNTETSRYSYHMLRQWNWVAADVTETNLAVIRGGTDGIARLQGFGQGGWIPRVKSYTVATLPAAASEGTGAIVYVSDEVGGPVLAFSDSANWRRVTDRAIVS